MVGLKSTAFYHPLMVQNPESRYTALGGAVDDNFDRNKVLSFFVESIFLPIRSLGRHCNHAFRRFMGNFDMVEFCDAVDCKLERYFLLRLMAFSAALSCAIPVMMFILFGITSFIVTFMAFIFIEGTFLLLCGMSMFFSMVMMIMVLSLLTAMMVACYVPILKLGGTLFNTWLGQAYVRFSSAGNNLRVTY